MIRLFAMIVLAAGLASPVFAQQQSSGDHVAHHEAAPADGEVRKVDKNAKKITIKHGPIQNLDMPAMTMVFQVKDPAMLDQVKAGDKVKFSAEKLGGALTVTRIVPAK
jgi:Cu/Ag efflux protein CusF